MKKVILTVAAVAVASFAADGAALFTKCASCHGKDGKNAAISGKVLAGQSAADIAKKLADYKAGNGGAKKGMMIPNAKALSDADMKALGEYISKLK